MRRLLVAALSALPAPLLAHEFWLQPATFAPADGAPLAVAVLVGDAADVKPWKFAWEKLHSFRDIAPDRRLRDLQNRVVADPDAAPLATVALNGAGSHMLVLETYHAAIELAPDEFNAYVRTEGLTAVAEARRSRGVASGRREIYSRRTKALVQIGAAPTDVTQPIGQTLEIVPLRNPYARSADARLPVRVLFEGRPLAGALTALTELGAGKTPVATALTGADGGAAFDVPRRGNWMVSVVWSRPIGSSKLADLRDDLHQPDVRLP